MADKLLVVILSGQKEEFRARQGLIFAKNAKKLKILDDVKVLLFGPGVEIIRAKGEYSEEFQKFLKDLVSEGVLVSACIANVKALGLEEDMKRLDIKAVGAALYISDLVKEGYSVITF